MGLACTAEGEGLMGLAWTAAGDALVMTLADARGAWARRGIVHAVEFPDLKRCARKRMEQDILVPIITRGISPFHFFCSHCPGDLIVGTCSPEDTNACQPTIGDHY